MSLSLLDWRRRVHALYADVRATADPAAAHQTWRLGRDELLATHPDSPVLPDQRATFTGVPVAPYDPALRFEAVVEAAEPHRLEVPTATDGLVAFERIGVVRLDGLGSLDVWWLGSYGGGVFLPVKDALAGRETYGGGRYLLDTVKGADLGGDVRDGVLILDLNFAYNPSCAYDPAWVCPLAPPGNTLAVPARGGELYPGA
jgi:uncharacterized protein (DUF1684 family)